MRDIIIYYFHSGFNGKYYMAGEARRGWRFRMNKHSTSIVDVKLASVKMRIVNYLLFVMSLCNNEP